MNLLTSLNTNQRKAVEAEGIVMIIAGPGTGKTKTLTARIQYLIEQKNIDPPTMLALTFTRKAATEMKERLSHLPQPSYIATFHALALDLLGISKKIISESERMELITYLADKHKKEVSKKEIKNLSLFITNYKNSLHNEPNPFVEEYNKLLAEKNLIDYDDLLMQLYTTLQIDNSKKRFQYIFVDEFQDTNILQYEILKLLLVDNNLFVIGDPLQSIYSFRGATADIFDKLSKDFPEHTRITLSTNYRSDKKIITTSSSLFPQNTTLIPFSKEQGNVHIVHTLNEYTEAEWIVKRIDTKIGGTDLLKAGENSEKNIRKTCFKDFAVIYRTHTFNRVLEQVLMNSGIPYQVIGDNAFYTRPEIHYIITVLRFLHADSAVYLHDLLTSSICGLSSPTKKKIVMLYQKNKRNYVEEVMKNKEVYISAKKDINVLSTFFEELEKIKIELKSKKVTEIIHKISNTKTIQNYIDSKALNLNNIHMLISIFTQFDKDQNSLQRGIEYITYLQEHEFYDQNVDKVTLLSMHAAKGLEFPEVFIVGVEEGSIPFIKKGGECNGEEEKRLLYVAMTRAKHSLYLLQTQTRSKQKTKQSQFIKVLQSMPIIQDEAIEKREKQIQKWKEKKSQLSLF